MILSSSRDKSLIVWKLTGRTVCTGFLRRDFTVILTSSRMLSCPLTVTLLSPDPGIKHSGFGTYPLAGLFKKKGVLVVLGIVSKPFQVDSTKLIEDQIRITGSDTGGMGMTQDCMDFMGMTR